MCMQCLHLCNEQICVHVLHIFLTGLARESAKSAFRASDVLEFWAEKLYKYG